MVRRFFAVLVCVCGAAMANAAPQSPATYDVVIYGGTSAAVTAAVQAARMNRSVVIVSPETRLGGMTSGGLGWTDHGQKKAIGGLSREFFHELWLHYQKPSAWKQQPQGEYTRGVGDELWWYFEPHVALDIFNRWIKDNNIQVDRDQWLDRENGVKMNDARIVSITMLSGKTYRGKMFIDATYEGDLMAAAGVSYTVGRESSDLHGESLAGARYSGPLPEDPYVKPGDPSSGLIHGVHFTHLRETGSGGPGVQAYNYRLCMTDDPSNVVPFTKPADYDPAHYELHFRSFECGDTKELPLKLSGVPNHKTDTNNQGRFSTDYTAASWKYPEASYAERKKIIDEHVSYQKGLLWALGHEPRVPQKFRDQMKPWGLAKDEFVETDHWPHQIYVREARRMISDVVMTEHHIRKRVIEPDSVGMGSYTMDSHSVQRAVDQNGKLRMDGGMGGRGVKPYPISYRSIRPKAEQCVNLLVPVCMSATHVAYGSIRMEPVYMILGQSAATAASLAIESDTTVQHVDYAALRKRLIDDGQLLDWPLYFDTSKYEGLVLDDTQAELHGLWRDSSQITPYIAMGYAHDGNEHKGRNMMVFKPDLKPGRYIVRLGYVPASNRATNVPVAIVHAGGKTTVRVDETRPPSVQGTFQTLGEFAFDADHPAKVVVFNFETDGFVVVDAMQFVRVDE